MISACCLHLIVLLAPEFVTAADLEEPLTLSSEHGVLDVLMIAKAGPIAKLPATPTGWIYEICKRPTEDATSCPDASSNKNYYGGTLLRLQPGDVLTGC
jgi:hypothetical protein